MAKIFITYRRADSAAACGRIYEHLENRFGRRNVFKDVDNIPGAVLFEDYIESSLRECVVQLVIIGKTWLTVTADDGTRRLDSHSDLVRREIELAISLGLVILPVLVEGAQMPSASDLPESLRDVTKHNAREVHNDPYFKHDVERLIFNIERILAQQKSLRHPSVKNSRTSLLTEPLAAKHPNEGWLPEFPSIDAIVSRVTYVSARVSRTHIAGAGGRVVLAMILIAGSLSVLLSSRGVFADFGTNPSATKTVIATLVPSPTATTKPTPATTLAPSSTTTVKRVSTATVNPTPTATVKLVPTATLAPVPTATLTPVPTATLVG